MTQIVEIGDRRVGDGEPVFIVAELSGNHCGSYETARKTLYAMKESGADAVKFQTYTADSLSINVDNEIFCPIKKGLWKGSSPYDLYKKASMPYEWQPKLAEYVEQLGLIWFSTPFDIEAVEFLEKIGCPAYKIASPEITDTPLIRHVASKGKPVIISTGVAGGEQIKEAVEACHEVRNKRIVLLKCTSIYPSPVECLNLNTIADMKKRFKTVVGLSDHTLSGEVAIASLALGARVIEKHFILDRGMDSPDSAFSMEPSEFCEMVRSVRLVEKALGKVEYDSDCKQQRRLESSRSLFVVKNIKKGERITKENVRSIRPGKGLHPRHLEQVLGLKVNCDIECGKPLTWDVIGQNYLL